MGWLETHIDEFVKPVVGDDFSDAPLGYFTAAEMAVIKNAWRAIKANAKGKEILLPGRDVFIFEILARRENYPTVFMPECSRQSVEEIAKSLPKKDWYLFDTGFAGSIPRGLNIATFGLLSHSARDAATQIFPRLTLSRHLALSIEGTPKYWESGRVLDGRIHQDFSRREEFIKAARLTIEVYKDSSPKFVKRHKPLLKEFAWM